ncbi:MAG: hypothetical protein GY824_12155, partial [Delftia sp.]|nr:hypothetical protein [Delftia sp.]
MSKDGPISPLFTPLALQGNTTLAALADAGVSDEMAAALEHAPSGDCVAWGIPFTIGDVLLLAEQAVSVALEPTEAQWLVFMHTSDLRKPEPGAPMRGQGQLAEHAADYIVLYADGTEERAKVCRRHQFGAFQRRWGENCFQAVTHHKPRPVRASHEQTSPAWGWSQMRATAADGGPWVNWLWAWENPHPDKTIVGVRFEPVSGPIVVSALAAGNASSVPLRWQSRRKAVFTLPPGETFQPEL